MRRSGLIVKLANGETRTYTDISESQRYTAKVESAGCLSVYRLVTTACDDLVFAEASFAAGEWKQWWKYTEA